MSAERGDVALLNDPVAQELLQSRQLAHFAYVAPDGTPRNVPIWFHWNGEELVFGTPPDAPKIDMLRGNASVAITIDTVSLPYKALLVRGKARMEVVEGIVPEYVLAAERYYGKEQGQAWVEGIAAISTHMARVTVKPEWVVVLDFVTRFPIAIERAMSRAQSGAES